MAKHDLSKLIQRGKDYVDEYESWTPPNGLNLKCVVEAANADETDEGLPRWGIMLRVASGEFEGKTFWVNARFSTQWDFMNKYCVDTFEALGIGGDALSELKPELVASSVEAKKVVVHTETNKKGYANHKLVAAKTTQSAPPPPPEPEPEDDDDWD